MLIYKDRLPIDAFDIVEVNLPYKSVDEAKKNILKLDLQYNIPNFWYIADKANNGKYFRIAAIGTGGHKHRNDLFNADNYLGTLVMQGGDLVLHYFIFLKNQE